MIKSVTKGLVIKVRKYKKRIPEHWNQRAVRKTYMDKIVTITSEPHPVPVTYKKSREVTIHEFYVTGSSFPWYSDDFVKANKIQ